MFRRIRTLQTRAKELLAVGSMVKARTAIDSMTMAAAQSALTEARKSATIENPRQALSFFFECFKPLTFNAVYKTPPVELDLLKRVLGTLQFRDATLPLSVAVPIALYADSLMNNFVFHQAVQTYSADIGLHFLQSSSLGSRARLIFNLVRALKSKACLEIGTAYGVSAYLIAACQQLCALQPHVVTVEKIRSCKRDLSGLLTKAFSQRSKDPS